MLKQFARVVAVAILVLGTPGLALACPVCFGQSDAPIAHAMNLAVLALLGLTTAVLGGFAAFFVYLMRQSRRAIAESGGLPGERFVREGGQS